MDPQPRSKKRETFLTLTLVAVLGSTIAFFLNLVSMGIFAYVLVAVLAFTAIGFLHYVLWGYALSQETAGEREELRVRDELEQEQADRAMRHAIKDIHRRRPHE